MRDEDLKKARILIVDDQEPNVRLLDRILKAAGYDNTRGLTNPLQVMPTWREWPADILLLDLMMPQLDGFGVMRLMQTVVPPDEFMPILAITADVSPTTRQQALSGGAKDFLTKPIDAIEVVLRIRNLLQTRFLYQEVRNQNQVLEQKVQERTCEVQEQADIIANASEAIFVLDAQDRVRFWNRGAERVYGWLAAEAVGRPVAELVRPRDPQELKTAQKALAENGAWVGMLRQLTRSNQEVIVDSRWTLVKATTGRPQSVLVLSTDITEKKKLEEQYLRAQRMESIGTLAGGIAHDLNNVLTPMLMAAEVLKLSLPEDRRLQMLQNLRTGAERGAALVRQILSFARGTEEGLLPMQLTPLVKETHKLLEHSLPKNIQVSVNLPADLWWIKGDGTQISQVVMNLCVNARDAMPAGGRLTISAENVTLDDAFASQTANAHRGRYVLLRVADTGCGIPPDVRDRVFEPFFTTKDPGKGTGLGLATVASIVRSHDGFVQLASEVGQGTRFAVYFPAISSGESRAISPGEPEMPPGKGERILVVDDEVAVSQIARVTLETHNYRVWTAGDGAEAVACYAQHRQEINLVLLDFTMPIMDGPDAIRVLRAMTPDLRIVIVSGQPVGHLGGEGPGLGENAFLPKPYTASRLLKIVRSTLDAP